MPRQPREFEPGTPYHLTSHGVDDRPIFRDDVDRQLFATRRLRVALDHAWRLFAVCLMDTHHHLVLEGGGISDGMKALNGGHSQAFNPRHGRRGALFESRFTDRVIRDEEHLQAAVQYVEGNAFSAGMVDRPEDWPWSTHQTSPLRVVLEPVLPTSYERGTFPCRSGSIVCSTTAPPGGETR
jgi:REP element-mobilizing transposase RayT